MSNTQTSVVVTLLHKHRERSNLANWRPISLLCVDYKIITKALAKRMVPALGEIIHPNQTCDIPNRSINNNLWLLRDLIDYATGKQDTAIIFSLDQEKAFDRVSHNFLIKVLSKFGFGPRFCKWIETLYLVRDPIYRTMGT